MQRKSPCNLRGHAMLGRESVKVAAAEAPNHFWSCLKSGDYKGSRMCSRSLLVFSLVTLGLSVSGESYGISVVSINLGIGFRIRNSGCLGPSTMYVEYSLGY